MDFFNDIKPLSKYTPQDRKEPLFHNPPKEIPLAENDIYTVKSYQSRQKYSLPLDTSHSRRNYSHGIWIFVVIAVIALLYALSVRFSLATITIIPKVDTVPINETLTLSKDINTVLYETVSIDTAIPQNQPLTEKVEKKEKATGEVILYNSYAPLPQKLVANTRFVSTNGNLYTLDQAVIIPGYTTINKQKIPGQIRARVTATDYGESYNINPDTLQVVLYKNTPKMDLVYAKNPQAFSGGLNGTYFTTKDAISSEDAKITLLVKLNDLVQKQIPEKYTYIEGLGTLTMDQNPIHYFKNETDKNTLSGSIEQIVLDRNSLIDYLKERNKELKDAQNIDLVSLKGKIITREVRDDITVFTVHITGDIKKENTIDIAAIKEMLAGVKKNDFSQQMSSLSQTIASAELSIKPFWIYTIPKTINRINIIEKNGR